MDTTSHPEPNAALGSHPAYISATAAKEGKDVSDEDVAVINMSDNESRVLRKANGVDDDYDKSRGNPSRRKDNKSGKDATGDTIQTRDTEEEYEAEESLNHKQKRSKRKQGRSRRTSMSNGNLRERNTNRRRAEEEEPNTNASSYPRFPENQRPQSAQTLPIELQPNDNDSEPNQPRDSKFGRRVGQRNFSSGERELLLSILESLVENNRIPQRTGFNWKEISAEFNQRLKQIKESFENSNDTRMELQNNQNAGFDAVEDYIPRPPRALKRLLTRLYKRQLKGSSGDGEELQQSFDRAISLVEWEERNKRLSLSVEPRSSSVQPESRGPVPFASAPVQASTTQMRVPTPIQAIQPAYHSNFPSSIVNPSVINGSFDISEAPNQQGTASNTASNTHSQHHFRYSESQSASQNPHLPYQSPRFLHSGHTPYVATGANTPSGNHGYINSVHSSAYKRRSINTYAGPHALENNAVESDDDDVQSKHSHTTSRSQGVGDMQFSQLLNDVYDTIDLPSLSQGYSNDLDGIFTPHGSYHPSVSNRDSQSTLGANTPGAASARRRRLTASSTGYESGMRKRLRRTTRGMSQDGTEFLNFTGGIPSTPAPSFIPTTSALGPNPTSTASVPNLASTGSVPGLGNIDTSAGNSGSAQFSSQVPGVINPSGVPNAILPPAVNYTASRTIEDLILIKDKIITQLQSSMYTVFQDLRHAHERIKNLIELEAHNTHTQLTQEQRHMTEVRTMEVVHREQIQDYEIKIEGLETQMRRMARKHQRDIKRVIKFVQSDKRRKALQRVKGGDTMYPYQSSFAQSDNRKPGDVDEYNYASYSNSRRNIIQTNSNIANISTNHGANVSQAGRLTSPPPFMIPSPIIPSGNIAVPATATSTPRSRSLSPQSRSQPLPADFSQQPPGSVGTSHRATHPSMLLQQGLVSRVSQPGGTTPQLSNTPLVSALHSNVASSSIGYNTGTGSLKKASTTSGNQQTKSVKLLSRDIIIKDNFSRRGSSQESSVVSDESSTSSDDNDSEDDGEEENDSGQVVDHGNTKNEHTSSKLPRKSVAHVEKAVPSSQKTDDGEPSDDDDYSDDDSDSDY